MSLNLLKALITSHQLFFIDNGMYATFCSYITYSFVSKKMQYKKKIQNRNWQNLIMLQSCSFGSTGSQKHQHINYIHIQKIIFTNAKTTPICSHDANKENITNFFLFENAPATSEAFRFLLDLTHGVEKSGVDVIRWFSSTSGVPFPTIFFNPFNTPATVQ